jgi:hypothetical protein
MMNAKVGSPVPSIIWDAFTDVLEANTLRLAKEIGQALGVSHTPLMAAIRAKKIQPYVVEFNGDERDIDLRCDYVCQKDAVVHTCGQAVLWRPTEVSKRCPEHLYSKKITYKNLPVLSPTSDPDLFLSDGSLFGTDAELKGGRYSATGKQIIFELVE